MRAKQTVSVTDVADGAVLLDQTTGVFYHVNQTGALAYRMVQSSEHTLDEVVMTVASALGIDERIVRVDVEAFFDDLIRHGLVQP